MSCAQAAHPIKVLRFAANYARILCVCIYIKSNMHAQTINHKVIIFVFYSHQNAGEKKISDPRTALLGNWHEKQNARMCRARKCSK